MSGQEANAVKTGKRLDRLTLGILPKKLRGVQRYCREYRRKIESAVMAAKGEIDIADAHEIDLMCKAERHEKICSWVLRNRLETMSATEVIDCSTTMTKAIERRNACFQRLGLDQSDKSITAALYGDDNADEA